MLDAPSSGPMAPDPALHLPTRIVFGPGAIAQLGVLVREVPATRAFLVTDPGLVRAGHVERAEKILAAAGVEVTAGSDLDVGAGAGGGARGGGGGGRERPLDARTCRKRRTSLTAPNQVRLIKH